MTIIRAPLCGGDDWHRMIAWQIIVELWGRRPC